VTGFLPRPNTLLALGSSTFAFMPHPLFATDADEVFAIEGGEAVIYQLRERSTGSLWAMKVTKPSYRDRHIARAAAALLPYASLPGLSLAHRTCLTRATHPELIARFPDLDYAVLMPWVSGRTWAGFMADRAAGERYTQEQATRLAIALAHALWNLEAHHFAHTDVAGGNLATAPDFKRVEFLDIEGLYMPNSPVPRQRSQGSPGYQHRALDQRGQWRPEGDRFAGAILLTEMLAWCDPVVRAQATPEAEWLFQPLELQEVGSPLWQAVRDALWNVCRPALPLFDQAWASNDLSECPELSAWALCLVQAHGEE
jgi:hypothetical protein